MASTPQPAQQQSRQPGLEKDMVPPPLYDDPHTAPATNWLEKLLL